ncbi:MAG: hydroxyacid dehydrogenase [Eubacterium sp.]|nr:hydroxyacid dehydrogenase [Eubacterium sp.]
MKKERLSASILNSFPEVDEAQVDAMLRAEIEKNDRKIIVLDDDPTGGQTIHDIRVYTDWSIDSIRRGFAEENRIFYVLTNSRGMTETETTKVHEEIMSVVSRVSEETGKPYFYISRSDSTLRGHYPLETELLKAGMEAGGVQPDGEILLPFFREGGRFTMNNIHYVKTGEELVPAAETEFARDATFGYTHSYLPDYIEEKTAGRYKAADVTCIALEDLRALRIDKIKEQLLQVSGFNKVCVNCVDYCDLKIFCIALYRAMSEGKVFLFRTSASFVKAVGGITDQPLLTREQMIRTESKNGGVVVVGSHMKKTTAQLEELLTLPGTVPVAFRSSLILEGEEAFEKEIERCVAEEEKILQSGQTAVCYTERTVISLENDTKESALLRSVRISDGVRQLVGRLQSEPSFIVAKGGITSSDVATKALGVRRAEVMGQIRPGIPVWKTDEESRFPGIPYVIFPGNVGEVTTLKEAVQILMGVQ